MHRSDANSFYCGHCRENVSKKVVQAHIKRHWNFEDGRWDAVATGRRPSAYAERSEIPHCKWLTARDQTLLCRGAQCTLICSRGPLKPDACASSSSSDNSDVEQSDLSADDNQEIKAQAAYSMANIDIEFMIQHMQEQNAQQDAYASDQSVEVSHSDAYDSDLADSDLNSESSATDYSVCSDIDTEKNVDVDEKSFQAAAGAHVWERAQFYHKRMLLQLAAVCKLYALRNRLATGSGCRGGGLQGLLLIVTHFFSRRSLYVENSHVTDAFHGSGLPPDANDPERVTISSHRLHKMLGMLPRRENDQFTTYSCCTKCSMPYREDQVRIALR